MKSSSCYLLYIYLLPIFYLETVYADKCRDSFSSFHSWTSNFRARKFDLSYTEIRDIIESLDTRIIEIEKQITPLQKKHISLTKEIQMNQMSMSDWADSIHLSSLFIINLTLAGDITKSSIQLHRLEKQLKKMKKLRSVLMHSKERMEKLLPSQTRDTEQNLYY